ncbi:MAG: hypothetical protein AB1753_08255 [Thermoproteota archaeon]
MMAQQQARLDIFQGKEGRNNYRVLKNLLAGPKTAYDIHKSAEDEMEYSTSNRRLRDLAKTGYISRISLPNKTGRKRIHYAFTMRGAIAALSFANDELDNRAWVLLIRNHSSANPMFGLFDRVLGFGLSVTDIKRIFVAPLLEGTRNGFLNLAADEEILAVNCGILLVKGLEKEVTSIEKEKRREVVETLYKYCQKLPFERYFGTMTTVLLGIITHRYISTSKVFARLFARDEDGDIRYTFRPLSDRQADKLFPFLSSHYSEVALKSIQAFREMASLLYAVYDEYGEM